MLLLFFSYLHWLVLSIEGRFVLVLWEGLERLVREEYILHVGAEVVAVVVVLRAGVLEHQVGPLRGRVAVEKLQ